MNNPDGAAGHRRDWAKLSARNFFARLEGAARLLAELMHGSGLRLSELPRLQVKDVDLRCPWLEVRSPLDGLTSRA